MALIQSGISTDLWTIDPTSKAGRVSLYDTAGNPLTTLPISGSISIANFPATQPVSGSVSIANFPVTQPVSGSVSISNFPATQVVSISGSASISNFPATQAVSGTIAVSNFPATQAVSGTIAISNFPATQAISAASLPLPTGAATAAKQPALGVAGTPSVDVITVQGLAASVQIPMTLASTVGKTAALKLGTLATTAITADQVILTYTVTAGKTFYLQYADFLARLTTYAATATLFGTVSIESPAGTKLYTTELFNAGSGVPSSIGFSEPIPIAAGVVIRVVCTPAATTAMTWRVNFGGFER